MSRGRGVSATAAPEVEHVVQVDIGQQGRRCRALRRTRLAFRDDPFFEYSRLKPFADQAEYALVPDPVPQEADKPVMTYRVEKLR